MKKHFSKYSRKGLPGGANEQQSFTEGFIVSKRGQWDFPGKPTMIPDANGSITTQGVKDTLFGFDDQGNSQIMYPDGEYQFPGNHVFEIPLPKAQMGIIGTTSRDKGYSSRFGSLNPFLAYKSSDKMPYAGVEYVKPLSVRDPQLEAALAAGIYGSPEKAGVGIRGSSKYSGAPIGETRADLYGGYGTDQGGYAGLNVYQMFKVLQRKNANIDLGGFGGYEMQTKLPPGIVSAIQSGDTYFDDPQSLPLPYKIPLTSGFRYGPAITGNIGNFNFRAKGYFDPVQGKLADPDPDNPIMETYAKKVGTDQVHLKPSFEISAGYNIPLDPSKKKKRAQIEKNKTKDLLDKDIKDLWDLNQVSEDPGKIDFVRQQDLKKKMLESPQEETRYRFQEGGESFELELTDEEIEQYKKGGYIIEELPKAQSGLTNQYNFGPESKEEREKLYNYDADQEVPDMILTLKDDKSFIDGIANWATVSGTEIHPEFNDQIKKKLYSGKWGYNPKTGYLVNLAKAKAQNKTTSLPESEKKYLKERQDVPYEQAIKNWNKDRVPVQIPDSDAWSPNFEFEGLGKTMNANEMRGQTVYMTQQEADDYLQAQLQSSIDATYKNPIMYAPGMIYTAGAAPALDLLIGAGSSLEPLSRGDYKEAALTFGLGALPMVPGAVKNIPLPKNGIPKSFAISKHNVDVNPNIVYKESSTGEVVPFNKETGKTLQQEYIDELKAYYDSPEFKRIMKEEYPDVDVDKYKKVTLENLEKELAYNPSKVPAGASGVYTHKRSSDAIYVPGHRPTLKQRVANANTNPYAYQNDHGLSFINSPSAAWHELSHQRSNSTELLPDWLTRSSLEEKALPMADDLAYYADPSEFEVRVRQLKKDIKEQGIKNYFEAPISADDILALDAVRLKNQGADMFREFKPKYRALKKAGASEAELRKVQDEYFTALKDLEKSAGDIKTSGDTQDLLNRWSPEFLAKMARRIPGLIPAAGAAGAIGLIGSQTESKEPYYQIGGSIEAELTPEQIQWYLDNGYNVDYM